jgi:heat shock protein HslJ
MHPIVPTLALLAAMSACAPKPDQGAAPTTASLAGPGGAQQPDLGGAPWRLVDITGATIPADMHPAQHPTLVFDAAASRVAGVAGVNRWNGQFTRTGPNGLTIAAGAMTRMAGIPEAMVLEDAYVKMLAQVRAYRLEGDRLTLLDERGATLASYRRSTPPG